MTTDSMEEYLETICKLSGEQSRVALSALADYLGISSVSANEMIKKLVARGLVTYEPYKEGWTRFSWLRSGYEAVPKKRNQVGGGQHQTVVAF